MLFRSIPLIANRDEVPLVVLNSDGVGNTTAKHLLESHYADHADRIYQLAEICGFDGAESEDLFPQDLVSMLVDRQLRVVDEEFVDVVKEGQPIIPQIEAFATKLRAKLTPGWKLELARRVKDRLPRNRDFGGKYPEYERRWIKLFSRFAG